MLEAHWGKGLVHHAVSLSQSWLEVLVYRLIFEYLFALVWNLHIVRSLVPVDLCVIHYLHLWLWLHRLVFIEIDTATTWLNPISVHCRVSSIVTHSWISSRLIIFYTVASYLIGFCHVNRTFVFLIPIICCGLLLWLHSGLVKLDNFWVFVRSYKPHEIISIWAGIWIPNFFQPICVSKWIKCMLGARVSWTHVGNHGSPTWSCQGVFEHPGKHRLPKLDMIFLLS